MKGFKFILFFSFCCLSNVLSAQTKSENYIQTKLYTQAVKNDESNSTTGNKVDIVYYDGLGRPIQEVNVGQSPTKKNIIKYTEYDLNVGKTKDYLPYALDSDSKDYTSGAKQATLDFYNTPKYGETQNPYSEIEYEKSPLQRVLTQSAPGEDWKLSLDHKGKNIRLTYRFNKANEVKYKIAKAVLNPTTGIYDLTIEDKGYYPANTLYVIETKDENGNVTLEFKDQEGKVVLKQSLFDSFTYRKRIKDLLTTGGNTNLTPGISSDLLSKELSGKTVQEVIDHAEEIGQNVINNVENSVNNVANGLESIGTGGGITLPRIEYTSVDPFNTYYIYDQYGNLSYITSPLQEGDTSIEKLNTLGYQYKYDVKNRLVAKKLPGKVWEYLVYDKSDRLIGSGPTKDPFGLGQNGWMISKYDALGRLLYNGFYSGLSVDEKGRKNFQDNINSSSVFYEKRANSTTVGGAPLPYTSGLFPNNGVTILMVNYYDDYEFLGSTSNFPTVIERQKVLSQVKGLPTGNWVRIPTSISESKANLSYMLYDYNNRILRNHTKNYYNGYTEVETSYSFTGLPLLVRSKHKKDTNSSELVVLENYKYDQSERLLYQTHQVNNQDEEVLFYNVYDDLGALEKKFIGGKDTNISSGSNSFLQEVDYKYNIRGWLTQLNDVDNLDRSGIGKRSLFAMKLNYNKTEQGFSEVKALYNGNIAEQIWTTASDGKKKGYGYAYDDLNRLVLGAFKHPDSHIVVGEDTAYKEKMMYDKNGNIQRLSRNGGFNAGKVAAIDDLTYQYENNSNKLLKVIDATANEEGFRYNITNSNTIDYLYDDFGNLIIDNNKGISKIKYNHLNLPIEINFGTDKIEYLYTALGEKVQKKVTEKGKVTLTDYLGGFQYVGGKLSFFPTVEGFFNTETNTYVYQYKDHLGNVRLSYSDKNKDNRIDANEIIEETNYYPFGLAHSGYNQKNDALMKDYKYQYNGKEKQEELGLNYYDYGARNYDATIGRWMNVDPLAEKMSSWNPYTYTFNNPIMFTDPDGMEPECDGCKGFVLSIVDNVFGSNLRNTYATDSPDYRSGVKVGHSTSLLASGLLITDGATNIGAGGVGLVASAAVSTTGVGAAVGVPSGTISGGVVVKGVTEVVLGTIIGFNTKNNMQSDASSKSGGGRTAQDDLPRNKDGTPKPDLEAQNTSHTQLGTKKGRNGDYRQAREFNEQNKPVRDIDFTDHGRPQNHPNPHQHDYIENATGGTLQRSKNAKPL